MKIKRNEWIGGVLLIVIGLFFLLNQFVDLPVMENLATFFMLGLGIFFLVWGVLTRNDGLMIPGGILSGIGLGIVLVTSGRWEDSGDTSGAVFMGAFALGWVLITVFSALFTDETHWWPLIPAAVMALISAALFVEGPFQVALDWLGKLWPLALIIGGIAILLGARRLKDSGGKTADLPDEDDIEIIKSEEA